MNPTRPPIPPPRPVEHTHWSFGLIGFYLSCAGVALGATIGAAGFLLFESTGALVFGSVLSLTSCVTCYIALKAARKPPESH